MAWAWIKTSWPASIPVSDWLTCCNYCNVRDTGPSLREDHGSLLLALVLSRSACKIHSFPVYAIQWEPLLCWEMASKELSWLQECCCQPSSTQCIKIMQWLYGCIYHWFSAPNMQSTYCANIIHAAFFWKDVCPLCIQVWLQDRKQKMVEKRFSMFFQKIS